MHMLATFPWKDLATLGDMWKKTPKTCDIFMWNRDSMWTSVIHQKNILLPEEISVTWLERWFSRVLHFMTPFILVQDPLCSGD